MKYLLGPKGLMDLRAWKTEKTLFAFDFDGTLSQIQKGRTEARIAPSTLRWLVDLSSQVPVAIISGRSLIDLKSRMPLAGAYFVGNHGLEGLAKWSVQRSRAKKTAKGWLAQFLQKGFSSGVEIEDKGYSLSIHFRKAKNKEKVRRQILNRVKDLQPEPRVIGGKSVYNLVPQNSPHKGDALIELKRRAKAKRVFYIGDDDTDEDVFSLSSSSLMKVRVGMKRTSKADYYIKNQSEINRLLKSLS